MTNEFPTLTCYVHPERETSLRCKVCERPICASCAVRTPTGYSCKECVRIHQKKFETAVWYDYILGFVVAAILSTIATLLVTLISGFFFGLVVLFLAPVAGTYIANILLVILKRRRSRALFMTISAGIISGAIPAIISEINSLRLSISLLGTEAFSIWSFMPLIWIVIFLFIAVPVVYSQYSGIRLSK